MSKSQKNLSATSKRMYMLSNDTPFVITEAYKTAVTNLIFSLATSQKKIVAFIDGSGNFAKNQFKQLDFLALQWFLPNSKNKPIK